MKITTTNYEINDSIFQNVSQAINEREALFAILVTDGSYRLLKDIVRIIVEYNTFPFSFNPAKTLKMTLPGLRNIEWNRKRNGEHGWTFYTVIIDEKPRVLTFAADTLSFEPIFPPETIINSGAAPALSEAPVLKSDTFLIQADETNWRRSVGSARQLRVYQPNTEVNFSSRHSVQISWVEIASNDRILVADLNKIGYYTTPSFDRFVPICSYSKDVYHPSIRWLRARDSTTFLSDSSKEGVTLWDFSNETPLDRIPEKNAYSFVNRRGDTVALYSETGNDSGVSLAYRIVNNKFLLLGKENYTNIPLIARFVFDTTDNMLVLIGDYDENDKPILFFFDIEQPWNVLERRVVNLDNHSNNRIKGLLVTDNTLLLWTENTLYQTIFLPPPNKVISSS